MENEPLYREPIYKDGVMAKEQRALCECGHIFFGHSKTYGCLVCGTKICDQFRQAYKTSEIICIDQNT